MRERVAVNLRVSGDVKDAYESAIIKKYGQKHPRAGTELEDELRFMLDRGIMLELWQDVSDIGDAYGKTPRENENHSTPNDDTEMVRYRIDESVRRGIMSLASESNCTNPGELIERIMHSYATGNSVEERLIDLTDRIKEATAHRFDDDLTAEDKRVRAIADEVDDIFTISEFRTAMTTATEPLSVKTIGDALKTRKRYLPQVLDEKECSWVPNKNKFMPSDGLLAEEKRDPRGKPPVLMDIDDLTLALKYHVYEEQTRLTVSDAVAVVNGGKSRGRVKTALQRAGSTVGYKFVKGKELKRDDTKGLLMISNNYVVETEDDHDRLQTAHLDLGNNVPLVPTVSDEVISELPDHPDNLSDAVIRNKIIKITNGADQNISKSDLKSIPDEQVSHIRSRATDDAENRGVEDDNSANTQKQSERDRIASASPTAATDGGIDDETHN